MGIEHSGDSIGFTPKRISSGDLSEHTNVIHIVEILDHITVGIFVLEQKGTHVRLSPLHHVLYGDGHVLVSNSDSFVETRE